MTIASHRGAVRDDHVGQLAGLHADIRTHHRIGVAVVGDDIIGALGHQHDVAGGDVALLPEGTYYIISNYGDANSVVRSDIRVQAGKLTDVIITHRAAVITLKLVSDKGGEALANTAWSVITPGGDVIKESIGAFPRVVLSEGEYRAIAKNEGKVYERSFNVVNGVDGEVEVVAR